MVKHRKSESISSMNLREDCKNKFKLKLRTDHLNLNKFKIKLEKSALLQKEKYISNKNKNFNSGGFNLPFISFTKREKERKSEYLIDEDINI